MSTGHNRSEAVSVEAKIPASIGFLCARILLILVLVGLILTGPGLAELIRQWWLPLIGVGGALVANSTGIGGGIVFVPAFGSIGLAPSEIVGTSLIIQSFGMTMGALTYLAHRAEKPPLDGLNNTSYIRVIYLTVIPAVVCAWLATKGGVQPDLPLSTIFKVISLALVVLIIGSEFVPKPKIASQQISWSKDSLFLLVVGILGGFFVGWISIGVGELLAVYLLLRGARGRDAIGLAVIVTAITVVSLKSLTGLSIPTDITTGLLVAPGALLGGFLAPYVLMMVGHARVKWFCAIFIVLSSLAV